MSDFAVESALRHAEDAIEALKGRASISPKQLAEARIGFLKAAKILGFSESLIKLGVYSICPAPYSGEQLRMEDGTPLLRTLPERETNYRSTQLGFLHQQILAILKEKGTVRSVDLPDLLPSTPNPKHLHNAITTLVDGGWIVKEGQTKATAYRLA